MAQKIIRYFECKTSGHNKFWEITYENPPPVFGASYSTRWGQIGASGSTKAKQEPYSLRDIEKLIASKVAKGYREVQKTTHNNLPKPEKPVVKPIPAGLEIF